MKSRVIFIDDDPLVLSGLKRALHEYDDLWDVVYVSAMADVERLLFGQPFDVVVTDMFMPLKSGIELLEAIKSDPRTRHAEVILLTGMQDEDLDRRALELGAACVLTKPFEVENLVDRIKAALSAGARRRSLEP